MTIHLSILIFWPLAARRDRRAARRAARRGSCGSSARSSRSCWRCVLLIDFDAAQAGLQYVTDDTWIAQLGIRYKLGVDGLNLWLIALTTLLFAATALWTAMRPPERAPGCTASTSGSPRPPCSARSWRRTWRCSSSSST